MIAAPCLPGGKIMLGNTIGPYRILGRLGRGGSGDVYRAHDPRLRRNVALKVLAPDNANDPQYVARLRREARLLAALNHPNIATIHGLEQDRGVQFLVMELVPGQTLRQLLRTGPLPLPTALDIGRQIALGLEAAHAHGVIHRDLTPANIKVTPEGRVTLLDFGLAKSLSPASHATALTGVSTQTVLETGTGVVVGTAPYMSPEQVRGKRLDRRTDIWSFGCVLYELLAGQRAFAGDTAADTLSAILEHEPNWCLLQSTVPPAIRTLLRRCLRKDPGGRLHDIADARIEIEEATSTTLGTLAAGARSSARRAQPVRAALLALLGLAGALMLMLLFASSIDDPRGLLEGLLGGRAPPVAEATTRPLALLPLTDLSGGSDEYFAAGLTEALAHEIARTGTYVLSPESLVRFRGSELPLREIAAQLGSVDAVLRGSVLREDGRVRIIVQLIDTASEAIRWSRRYERELTGMLALQREIALAVAREIDPVVGAGSVVSARRDDVDAAAYDAYLRGRFFWRQRGIAELHKAGELFTEAIQRDPGFALAHAGLADVYTQLGYYYVLASPVAFSRAASAASRAIEIEPDLAEAHAALGSASTLAWRWARAEQELQAAIRLNGNYATAHQWYGQLLVYTGRADAGIEQLQQALRLDPLGLATNRAAGIGLVLARRVDDAIERFRKGLELYPDSPALRVFLGMAYARTGAFEAGLAAIEEAVAVTRRHPSLLPFLGHAYALAGRRSDAAQVLQELLQARETGESRVGAEVLAWIPAAMGEVDEAMRLLEIAYQEHGYGLIYTKMAPEYDPLRGDPRFQRLVARLNFPQ